MLAEPVPVRYAQQMDIKDLANVRLGPLEPLAARIYRYAKRLPIVREKLEAEYAPIMEELRKSAKPYADELENHPALPKTGKDRADILTEIRQLQQAELRASVSARHSERQQQQVELLVAQKRVEWESKVFKKNLHDPLYEPMWPQDMRRGK